MEFKDFTAGKDDSDRRLDRVLRIFLKEKGLPEIYKLLRKDLIKLNHKKAKPETHVSEGDVISIAAFLFDDKHDDKSAVSKENKSSQNTVPRVNLKVVFENEHLLIIDKPYDRTVHGKTDGLYNDVIDYLNQNPTNQNTSLSFTPGPLHRLDRKTTGLLVFSKSLKGARWFTEGIQNHTVQKKYYGLAQGYLKHEELWKDFITDAGENDDGFYTVKAKSEAENSTDEVACETKATPVAHGSANGNDFTLVDFAIKTGRKHQIRSQSALHKFPLAGDTAYGAKKLCGNKNCSRDFYLQAYCLSFPDDNPIGLPPQIKIGLSSDFIEQLQCCGINNSGL